MVFKEKLIGQQIRCVVFWWHSPSLWGHDIKSPAESFPCIAHPKKKVEISDVEASLRLLIEAPSDFMGRCAFVRQVYSAVIRNHYHSGSGIVDYIQHAESLEWVWFPVVPSKDQNCIISLKEAKIILRKLA